MRKNLLNNKKGFTLAELLIVVAIIAILVAISIPVFAGKLESARESTDKANERAAKAAALNVYLEEQSEGTWYYDAENGKLVKDTTTITTAYGKSSKYPSGAPAVGKIIKINVNDAGEVEITWVSKDSSALTTPTPTP